MNKVRLPYIVQDQLTATRKGMKPVEFFYYEDEDEVFLDGPVSKRVAVVDFDAKDGRLQPSTVFEPPTGRRTVGRYVVDESELESIEFTQVSVFSTVLKTMRLFEMDDILGRRLTWAFRGPQLLVVPRAGLCANAFYERDSRSLQFFCFDSLTRPGKRIYTSLSHDIVSHETGHAILDGIAPDLYDAITPQSLALHEAIADLTSLVMSIDSGTLRKTVLDQSDGSIDGENAFSAVASEFGEALGHGRLYLRSLKNNKTLDRSVRTKDRHGDPDYIGRSEPHDLSQVLTGALFEVLANAHEKEKRRASAGIADPGERRRAEFRASGKALAVATYRFRRLIFRALDYLPPGEVSFADYGRAMIAADQAAHPQHGQERERLKDEFARRKIVSRRDDLEVQTNYSHPAVAAVDPAVLVESDWAAYEFANANRKLLRIPGEVPFHVGARLDVTKKIYGADGEHLVRECIFKVSWKATEPSELDRRFPRQRIVTVGTTLVIDWETRQIRALLTTDQSARQRKDRTLLLRKLQEQELLLPGDRHTGPGGARLASVLRTETNDDTLQVCGAARTLHIVGQGDHR